MTAVEHLAVYGTLRPGAANEHVLDDVPGEWQGGTLRGTRHEDGWHGYPGVVLGGDATVTVSVLASSVLEQHLDRLDAFEGAGYRRVRAAVHLDEGTTVEAWVYELAAPPR